jgi:zinc transporter
MSSDDSCCGTILDGRGGGRRIDWSTIRNWTADQGTLWLVLDRDDDRARRWLIGESGIDPVVIEALLAPASRPRADAGDGGLVVVLRCVDPTPGAEPEELISIRVWAEPHRVVMTCRERPKSIVDLEAQVPQSAGPRSAGEVVARLVEGVTTRLIAAVEDVEEAIDELEDQVVDPSISVDSSSLGDLRHRIIGLHRYLLPQVHALTQIGTINVGVLDAKQQRMIQDAANRSMRCVDDLDAARGRAVVIQDELANRLTEQLNRRIYAISLFAAIFLPLTLITGLLGVNLSGIPYADDPWAFAVLCLLLVVLGALGYWIVRWFRLL